MQSYRIRHQPSVTSAKSSAQSWTFVNENNAITTATVGGVSMAFFGCRVGVWGSQFQLMCERVCGLTGAGANGAIIAHPPKTFTQTKRKKKKWMKTFQLACLSILAQPIRSHSMDRRCLFNAIKRSGSNSARVAFWLTARIVSFAFSAAVFEEAGEGVADGLKKSGRFPWIIWEKTRYRAGYIGFTTMLI